MYLLFYNNYHYDIIFTFADWQDLESIYFNPLYISDPSTRPSITSIDDTIRILSIILDLFDSTLNITAREVLCTTTYVEDLTTHILLSMDSGEFDDIQEFTGIMMVRFRVSGQIYNAKDCYIFLKIILNSKPIHNFLGMFVLIVYAIFLGFPNMVMKFNNFDIFSSSIL